MTKLVSATELSKIIGIDKRTVLNILKSEKANAENVYEHFFRMDGSKYRIDHEKFFKLYMRGEIG